MSSASNAPLANRNRSARRIRASRYRTARRPRKRWPLVGLCVVGIAAVFYFDRRSRTPRPLQALQVEARTGAGEPVAGIQVAFFAKGATHESPRYVTQTDTQGIAELPAAQADGEFFCVGRLADGTVTQAYVMQNDPIGRSRLRFARSEPIRGYIFDADGIPAAEATVEALFAGGPPLAITTPGEDGHFRFDTISSTLPFLTIRVRKTGYAAQTQEWDRLASSELDFVLVRTHPLRLRVVLPDGTPIANAPVTVMLRPDLSRTTDAEGRVQWDELDPKSPIFPQIPHRELTYRNDGFVPLAAEQLFRFDKPAVLVGRVLAYDGAPVADVEVRHPHGPRAWVRARTDSGGWFRLGDLPPGEVTLIYELPSGELGESIANMQAGETKRNFVIRLAAR